MWSRLTAQAVINFPNLASRKPFINWYSVMMTNRRKYNSRNTIQRPVVVVAVVISRIKQKQRSQWLIIM